MNKLNHRLSLALPFLLWTWLALASPAQANKAIALVYDDSGSMISNHRWVAANYSVQVLIAITGESDSLYVVKMSDSGPEPAKSLVGAQGIESLLQWFRQQTKPDEHTGTPYRSIRKAIDALVSSSAEEKWLLVLTDGGFDEENEAIAHADIALALENHVRTAFLLIQQQKHELAELWEREGHAVRFNADSNAEIPAQMEAIADLLNARSSQARGVNAKVDGIDWMISSRFPLRHLIVLRQDSGTGKLIEAYSAKDTLYLRRHDVAAREKNKGLPEAHVAHISGSRVMEAGDNVIRLHFDKPTELIHVKLFPDVAAKFVFKLKDAKGAELQPDKTGIYSTCEGDAVFPETRLLDDEGKSITPGRPDIADFNVGVYIDKKFEKETLGQPGQEFFSVKLTPISEVELIGSAVYPGYFHFQSEPIRLRPVVCSRDIRLTINGVDGNGQWQAEVDRIEQASFVEIGVMINGKPASPEDIAQWSLSGSGNVLQWQQHDTGWSVRPKTACCAWMWARASVGENLLTLTLDTHNPRDKIQLPHPIRFVITKPGELWRVLWWYLCPLAVLMLSLFLLWYLRCLLVKQRFANKACLWSQDGATKVLRAIHLRKRTSWLMRWFWPSARDKATIDGMRFFAQGRGASILMSGNALNAHYEIEGWMFDEILKAKGKPQRDVRINDKAEVIVLDPSNRQRGVFSRRYKYCRDSADPGWS